MKVAEKICRHNHRQRKNVLTANIKTENEGQWNIKASKRNINVQLAMIRVIMKFIHQKNNVASAKNMLKRTPFKQPTLEQAKEKQRLARERKIQRARIKKEQDKQKKIERKIKYENIKTIENRIWELCKKIVRQSCMNEFGYLRCYTCSKTITELDDAHTGHWRKKGILSIRHKYDLRGLRVQCAHCNKYLDGNEAQYTLNLIREIGQERVFLIDEHFRTGMNQPMGSADARQLLQKMEVYYKGLLLQLERESFPHSYFLREKTEFVII